jgi:hypothetical protein
MTKQQRPTVDAALGVSVDGTAVTSAIYNGTDVKQVPLVDDGPLASTLVVPDPAEGTALGVTGVRADRGQYGHHAVDVFPRFDGLGGVPETDRERFQVGATELFGHLREGLEQELFGGGHRTADGLPVDTTVSVPGVYEERDRKDVSDALAAVGIADAKVVRAPLGTAASRLPSLSEPSTVVAVEIGQRWCNAAVVKVNPDSKTLSVQTRVVESDIGSAQMDRAVAKAVLQSEQQQRNYSIEPAPDAFSRVVAAAHESLNGLVGQDSAELSVSDLEDVTLGMGTPPIDIETEVDTAMVISVLEDSHEKLAATLSTLMERHGLTADAVDDVVVAGSGTIPESVRNTVGAFFDRGIPSATDYFAPLYRPASGAAIIGHLRKNHEPIQRETTDGAIGLRLPESEGQLQFNEIAPPTSATGEPYEHQLKPTSPQQKSGILVFATRHQATGELTTHEKWGIFGLPHADGEIQPVDVDIVPTDRGENIVDVRPLNENVEATRISEPPAPEIEIEETEWVVRSETDLSDIRLPESEDDVEPVRIDEPIAESFDETSPKQILETLLGVRYELWKFAEQENAASPSDLRDLLKRYDTGLLRINVDVISPTEGEEKKRSHRIRDTKPSPKPDGKILGIRRPGYRVDGYIEKPADVIVSKGETDPETKATASEDETKVDTGETSEEMRDTGTADDAEASVDTTNRDTNTDEVETNEEANAERDPEAATSEGSTDNAIPRDDSKPADGDKYDNDLQLDAELQDSSGTTMNIALRVSDTEKNPVEGAQIDITSQGTTKERGTTNATGTVEFNLKRDKKYKAHIKKPESGEDSKIRSVTKTIFTSEDPL